MTFGTKPRTTWLALLLLTAATAQSSEFDLPTLLAQVARPVPDATRFVEVRYSHLLKAPLAVAGTLERGADGSLVRRIESPYRETTTVRGRDVVIARDGSSTRRFSLDRVPELRGLLGSIDGMLRGDAALLGRSFASSLEGSPAQWRVRLAPLDERLRRRLDTIVVSGTDDAVRCFAMDQPTGDASIIALGAGSPDAVSLATREALEAWCRRP